MAKSYRPGRLAEEIKKLISDMLMRDLKDPRLDRMITISGVDVSGDGSYATCYFTVLGAVEEEARKKEEEEVLAGLTSAAGLIRKEIGKRMKLRHAPELQFKVDRSLEYGMHIEEVIRSLNED